MSWREFYGSVSGVVHPYARDYIAEFGCIHYGDAEIGKANAHQASRCGPGWNLVDGLVWTRVACELKIPDGQPQLHVSEVSFMTLFR